MTPCAAQGFSGDFPFDISGCHEACYPSASFPGGPGSATNGDQHPVAILQIKHETSGDIITTSVEWLPCAECKYDWQGEMRPGEEISWYESFQYIVRFWTKNQYETLCVHFDDLTGLTSSAIYLSEARLYATECYVKEACGLCGYYSGGDTDDFRFRLDYHAADSEFGSISTDGVWDAHSLEPWVRMQNFTLQWMSQDAHPPTRRRRRLRQRRIRGLRRRRLAAQRGADTLTDADGRCHL